LLTFDDFVQGVEDFGQRIQPLMKCREHIVVEADAPRVVLEKSA
jgi:pyrimidine oxygenase